MSEQPKQRHPTPQAGVAAKPPARPPDGPDEPEDLKTENALLRDRLARVERERAASGGGGLTYTAGPKRWYRVTLGGVKVRCVDDQGRPYYQGHLDVEAVSPGDAFEAFKSYSGILSTDQRYTVEESPLGEDNKPLPSETTPKPASSTAAKAKEKAKEKEE